MGAHPQVMWHESLQWGGGGGAQSEEKTRAASPPGTALSRRPNDRTRLKAGVRLPEPCWDA